VEPIHHEGTRVVGGQELGERGVERLLAVAVRADDALGEQGRVSRAHRGRIRAGGRGRASSVPAAAGEQRDERRQQEGRTSATSLHEAGDAYSTVTVFARLRGWSTFRPLSRATW